jgi:hypothetical protein
MQGWWDRRPAGLAAPDRRDAGPTPQINRGGPVVRNGSLNSSHRASTTKIIDDRRQLLAKTWIAFHLQRHPHFGDRPCGVAHFQQEIGPCMMRGTQLGLAPFFRRQLR